MSWSTRLLVVALVVNGCLLIYGTSRALAAPVPAWTNACTADINPASCERLSYIASELSVIDDSTNETVSRTDLTWIGVWFCGGVSFGVVFGSRIWSEVRKWHGGFR